MKWLTGMAAVIAIAIAVLGWLNVDRSMPRARIERSGIQIVAGAGHTASMQAVPHPGTSAPPLPAAPPPPSEETTITRPDAEALAALFETQVRDPSWAPAAEKDLRSHLSGTGDVRCAEFMCRIVIPLPDRSMPRSADQQAETVARRWSPDLSYNRLTATIAGDRQPPRLTFYVTRSSGNGQVE